MEIEIRSSIIDGRAKESDLVYTFDDKIPDIIIKRDKKVKELIDLSFKKPFVLIRAPKLSGKSTLAKTIYMHALLNSKDMISILVNGIFIDKHYSIFFLI